MRCFLDSRRVGAVVCCPRRVSLCRMQLPEDCFRPSVRWGLGAERPIWPRGHGWGLGAEALRAPNPTSPRRRTRGDWVSRAGEPQQSSRAQGSRGSPAQLRPMESGGPVSKTDSGAFHSGGRWSCGLLPRRVSLCRMQLPEAPLGPSVRGGLTLSSRAGSGGMAGTRAQKDFARPILLPHEGEPVGSGFRAPETPSKAAGPKEPG